MPTVFTHAIVALAASRTLVRRTDDKRVLLWAVVCSALPDVDVLSFVMGIPYHHWLGHRGFTHSLFFALLLSAAVVWVGFRDPKWIEMKWRLLSLFFVVTASHGLLDALTDGGLGIAFFAPFDNTRYFLPIRPIRVSPIGVSFFSQWGLQVLLSEFFRVWLPLGTILAVGIAARRIAALRRRERRPHL